MCVIEGACVCVIESACVSAHVPLGACYSESCTLLTACIHHTITADWLPRWFVSGREDRVFVISFFGLDHWPRPVGIPLHNVLTPYPLPNSNRFLGFIVKPRWTAASASKNDSSHVATTPLLPLPKKRAQGVVWGKLTEYFAGQQELLQAAASVAELHFVAPPLGQYPGAVIHNHLTATAWHALLAESAFLLGVGKGQHRTHTARVALSAHHAMRCVPVHECR